MRAQEAVNQVSMNKVFMPIAIDSNNSRKFLGDDIAIEIGSKAERSDSKINVGPSN